MLPERSLTERQIAFCFGAVALRVRIPMVFPRPEGTGLFSSGLEGESCAWVYELSGNISSGSGFVFVFW